MAPPDKWATPPKFYVLILIYSIQRLFYYFLNLIFHPQKFKKEPKFVVAPKCLSSEDNGTHHYAKLAVRKEWKLTRIIAYFNIFIKHYRQTRFFPNKKSLASYFPSSFQRTKFHYVEQGNRKNNLLLLIHGYPEFWFSWRYQVRNLSAHYWVVALDMKGHGDSDKPKSQREYDIPVLIEEIRDFLTVIGMF